MATQRRAAPRQLRYEAGPFRGMRDALDQVAPSPAHARLLQNCYPIDPVNGSAVVGRPGFQQMGAIGGASSKRVGQLVGQFTKRDGTTYTVRIVGGQGIDTFNHSSRTWTNVVTVANLTTNSITLSETSRISAVVFTDKLVISDGVNVPWMWDGTSGSTGLTKLTNCPVLYGPPVVYFAKLTGIKNSQRNVLVWSEENDATVGYENASYSNSWEMVQTNSEGAYALAPTEDVMYVLRGNSTTAVYGAVSSEFTSTGTQEAVSGTVGTRSPWSVLVHGAHVYFLDSMGRPQVIVGGRLQDPPLWQDVRETCKSVNVAALDVVQSWYDPETRLVCIGYPEGSGVRCSAIFGISPLTRGPVAIFRGYEFDRVGVVYNAALERVVVHLASDGYSYDHGTEGGTLWSDAFQSGTAAITHIVESPYLGYDTAFAKRWQRLDFTIRSLTATSMAVQYSIPSGATASLTVSVTSIGLATFGSAIFGTSVFGGSFAEMHGAVGWNGSGRWLTWKVTHATAGEQFAFLVGTVKAIPADQSPTRP